MDPRDLSDDDLDQLAQQLAGRLPTGTHGDRVVLSRRQFALAASGVLSAGALTALGVDEASAQAAGQVGTSSDPVDAFAYDLNVANQVTSSLPMNGNNIENAGSVSTDALSHRVPAGSDVSGSRSFDTTYQNSSGAALNVTVRASIPNTGTDDLKLRLISGPTSSLSFAENTWDIIETSGGSSVGVYTLNCVVEDRGYYELASLPDNDATIDNWWERVYK